MDTAIIVAIISAATGVTASALTFFLTKKKEREAEWRKQKLDHYKELIAALNGIVGVTAPSDAKIRFAHAANNIFLVGSPGVLVALRTFLDETAVSKANETADRHDELLTELLYAIRADLGIKPNRAPANYEFRLWAGNTQR